MKARIFSLISVMGLALVSVGVTQASAATKTNVTGSWTITEPGWVDLPGYPKCIGHAEWKPYQEPPEPCPTAIHDLADTYWQVEASDPRLSGVYVLRTTCNFRKVVFVGPCKGTFTADTDNDQKPEWEGTWAFGSNWTVIGHGLDEYAGLNVLLKVNPTDAFLGFTVDGHLTGK